MTINEASEQYNTSIEVLKEYESRGLCDEVRRVMGVWQYDNQDIQRSSMTMTFHDVDLDNSEAESYVYFLLEGDSTEKRRLDILDKERGVAFNELHFKQKQLDRIDYLRYKIQKALK